MIVLTGWMSQHGAHALSLLVPALLLTLVVLGGQARVWLHRYGHRRPTPLVLIVAMLSAVAATVHAVVCPEHFREWLLYGQFFAVAAGAQLAWAGLAIWRPRRWLLVAGLAGNLATLTLWAITRTVGIPLGPAAGETEVVGALDVIATVCEAGIVIGCAWMLIRSRGVLTPRKLVAAGVSTDGS